MTNLQTSIMSGPSTVLVIDLDGTLIRSSKQIKGVSNDTYHSSTGPYHVYYRPGMLDWLALKLAEHPGRVIIWSAGAESYVQHIINNILTQLPARLEVPLAVFSRDFTGRKKNMRELRRWLRQRQVYFRQLVFVDDIPHRIYNRVRSDQIVKVSGYYPTYYKTRSHVRDYNFKDYP